MRHSSAIPLDLSDINNSISNKNDLKDIPLLPFVATSRPLGVWSRRGKSGS